ncbi:VanZ family protein [Priestia flexa]|uniref:VanZ family protein n=1 Tax=Priestia flexa TaxID=86664 RepID=UPI0039B36AC1
MVKKLIALLLMLAIAYFSHTPHLQVTDPGTWNNPSVWDHNATIGSVLNPSGEFFTAYSYGFNTEFILRKIAHITFFGILALLFYWNLRESKTRYIKAWILLTLFAFTDEVHQAFIVGRDGRIVDVLVDSFGGALFLYLLYRFKQQKKA